MAKKCLCFLFVLVACLMHGVKVFAVNIEVPKYINYQAVLFDENRRPLQDGMIDVYLKILDSNFDVVYEEVQEVEVLSGVVSMAIGRGEIPGEGVLTGGISIESLMPGEPKYLEVQAEGYPPEPIMEIVSVPYSSYATVAFKVIDQSIGENQIKEKSISLNHLKDDLVAELKQNIVDEADSNSPIISRTEFNDYKNIISDTQGALNVGVDPDFSYSSSKNVQDVLVDLDLSIKKRAEDSKMVDVGNLNLDGSDSMKGTLNMAGNTITGVKPPVASTDATPKEYVDSKISSITPATIDAVSREELFDNGVIKDEKMPDTIVRVSDINGSVSQLGSGKAFIQQGGWVLDQNNTNLECYIDYSGTSMMNPPRDYVLYLANPSIGDDAQNLGGCPHVVCVISKKIGDDPNNISCNMLEESFETKFSVSVSVKTPPGIMLPTIDTSPWKMFPTSVDESITIYQSPVDFKYRCAHIVSFALNHGTNCHSVSLFNDGSSVSWTIYKKNDLIN